VAFMSKTLARVRELAERTRITIFDHSAVYVIFREAILERKQVTCRYQGYYRELCPVVIGHARGQ